MNRSNHKMESLPVRNEADRPHSVFEEKPTKAIIGLGVLIVLSLLLYEVNHSRSDSGSQQKVVQRLHTPSATP